MKFKDIAGLKIEELKKRTKELRAELFTLKMKNKLGQVGNPVQIRSLRKDIARMQTALSSKKN